MTHILAAAPATGGLMHGLAQVGSLIEKFAVILGLLITIGVILWRGAPIIWIILSMIILGMVIIPSLSPDIAREMAKLNSGSSIGTTGASIGEIVVLVVVVGVTIFFGFFRGRGQG